MLLTLACHTLTQHLLPLPLWGSRDMTKNLRINMNRYRSMPEVRNFTHDLLNSDQTGKKNTAFSPALGDAVSFHLPHPGTQALHS